MASAGEKEIRLAVKLYDLRDALRRRHGNNWQDVVAKYRPHIEGMMKEEQAENPLEAVLPHAQKMSALGHNPLCMLAAAVEMVEPSP